MTVTLSNVKKMRRRKRKTTHHNSLFWLTKDPAGDQKIHAKLEPFGLIIVAALLFILAKTGKMAIAINELQNFMYSLI